MMPTNTNIEPPLKSATRFSGGIGGRSRYPSADSAPVWAR
jgi:hypothetical protein